MKTPKTPARVMPSFFVYVFPFIFLLALLQRENLPHVPFHSTIALCSFNQILENPVFSTYLKGSKRAAWKVIRNYYIFHCVQGKHQQFIRQRRRNQMDQQLLPFTTSGCSFLPNYLMLAFSLHLTNKSTKSMGNGLHPAQNQTNKQKTPHTCLHIKTMNF